MKVSALGPGKAAILGLLFVLLSVACAQQPPARVETVRVGELGYMADLMLYIGVVKGYFAEQRIDVNFQRFRSATDMIAPLSTGDLEVGGGSVSAGLLNAVARG
ncbi:MAG: hypothetical protein Q8R28_10485, partial [Dehalococcoidia bacterium]|nr:hypothetical protein [Dehalococcoidia bacterium]